MNVDCYRCGYDLRGIADEQPCPECGLLARRSRRATDELHETRPKWLRSISWGSNLILLSILITMSWPFVLGTVSRSIPWVNLNQPRVFAHVVIVGFDVAAILLIIGVVLLTAREGYAPADRADRWRRIALRIASAAPLLAIALQHLQNELWFRNFALGIWDRGWTGLQIAIVAIATIGSAPLLLLLFYHLRSLAGRARSAHLAEHCAIVGIGTAAALVYVPIVMFIYENAERWGWGTHWTSNAGASLILLMFVILAAILSLLWSLYLLIRFALAFRRASQTMGTRWKIDDRSIA